MSGRPVPNASRKAQPCPIVSRLVNPSRAGCRVLLLDRDRALGGCTAAGGGMLSLQTKRPGAALRLARRSMSLLEEAAKRYQDEIGLRWCGSMVLARSTEDLACLEARAA